MIKNIRKLVNHLGYRSDVRIVTSKKAFDRLNEIINKKIEGTEIDNLLDYCNVKKIGNEVCYFGWNDIKWYEHCEGYEDIDAVEDALDQLMDEDLSYNFARMGENVDDYDERCNDGDSDEMSEDSYLPYPFMARYFDDEYVEEKIEQVNYNAQNSKQEDIEVCN